MDLKKIKNLEDLKKIKANFFSKTGPLKKLQDQVKVAKDNEKAEIGKKITKLKNEAEIFFAKAKEKISELRISSEITKNWIDVSIPPNKLATFHPLTIIENRFRTWLYAHGYYETKGSEIESDEFNFAKLNMPQGHPARGMQDSLYINKNQLLRTHNTGFSVRELLRNKNRAFAHFTIGSVYRNDEDDATHSHQFTQLDFVAVGQINFRHLVTTLKDLLSYVFEKKIEIRIRTSYFPFTEPSIEVDIWHNQKWVEVVGAGLMHPNVMKNVGYSNKMVALAAGIGIERIAMIKYQIHDIREFYKNDFRFLNQFQGVK